MADDNVFAIPEFRDGAECGLSFEDVTKDDLLMYIRKRRPDLHMPALRQLTSKQLLSRCKTYQQLFNIRVMEGIQNDDTIPPRPSDLLAFDNEGKVISKLKSENVGNTDDFPDLDITTSNVDSKSDESKNNNNSSNNTNNSSNNTNSNNNNNNTNSNTNNSNTNNNANKGNDNDSKDSGNFKKLSIIGSKRRAEPISIQSIVEKFNAGEYGPTSSVEAQNTMKVIIEGLKADLDSHRGPNGEPSEKKQRRDVRVFLFLSFVSFFYFVFCVSLLFPFSEGCGFA